MSLLWILAVVILGALIVLCDPVEDLYEKKEKAEKRRWERWK